MINKVTVDEFNEALSFVRSIYDDVKDNTVESVTDGATYYLSDDRLSGVGVSVNGELIALFSKGSVRGNELVKKAIESDASHLNCFDNGLVEYYVKFGFRPYKRKPNWTQGEPDVVYMWRTVMG